MALNEGVLDSVCFFLCCFARTNDCLLNVNKIYFYEILLVALRSGRALTTDDATTDNGNKDAAHKVFLARIEGARQLRQMPPNAHSELKAEFLFAFVAINVCFMHVPHA